MSDELACYAAYLDKANQVIYLTSYDHCYCSAGNVSPPLQKSKQIHKGIFKCFSVTFLIPPQTLSLHSTFYSLPCHT